MREGGRFVTGTFELVLAPIDTTPESDGRGGGETATWVRRARAGDPAAFAWLVARHERMVLRTALRLLGSLDRAEDAAQETFLRLHKYLRRFDESRELGPWLYRVVVNVCHDLARSSAATRMVSLDDSPEIEPAATHGSPEEMEGELAHRRELDMVQEALMTLPEKERAALVLRDIEGLTTSEVAQILGSREGTVRSQISTARVKIKRFVDARRLGRP
jgi:RNA polymerase sigma-70 factor, ECF subfamily